tara:strand:- start:1360 stop:1545 length:186 start_codon:yes stop_codon:yes gene_type:complete
MSNDQTKVAIESILRFLKDDFEEAQSDINSDRWTIGYVAGVATCINTIEILTKRWKDKGLL